MNKEIVLRMSDIVKTFPGVKALDGASLNIYKGRVMALMGENGAGKSTLIKVMTEYTTWIVEVCMLEILK